MFKTYAVNCRCNDTRYVYTTRQLEKNQIMEVILIDAFDYLGYNFREVSV